MKYFFLFLAIGVSFLALNYNDYFYTKTISNNEYAINGEQISDYIADSYDELKIIIYSILNSGINSFTFKCNYDTCMEDYTDVITITHNYVHPYNTYKIVNLTTNILNEVNVEFLAQYSTSEINDINFKLEEIILEIIDEEMNDMDVIRVFHDYVINNTVYDSDYNKTMGHPSSKATGPLFYNTAVCGGYTDLMSIFLHKLGYENIRLSSTEHIWNYVKLDGIWYHLDLTWDDPVNESGTPMLLDTFFLITDEELSELNTGFHDYEA